MNYEGYKVLQEKMGIVGKEVHLNRDQGTQQLKPKLPPPKSNYCYHNVNALSDFLFFSTCLLWCNKLLNLPTAHAPQLSKYCPTQTG